VHRGTKRWVWLRRPGWIVFAALTLRLAVLGVFLAHNRVSWGVNEPAGIARAIVEGRGFSAAFHDATGPTAWVAPAYPALLACIFRIFGVTSAASAITAILLNVVFSSLTAAVLVKLGREQLSEAAGIVAGWAWAMAPPLLFIPWLLWETCLSGLVLPFAFLATLRLTGSSRSRDWAWCGVIWSFGALLNPAMLAPLPALAIDAALRSRRRKQPVLMIAVCLLGTLPWTVRNFHALGQIVPVRSNFWPEVYFGNITFSLHPTGDSMLYQNEGEMRFAADLRGRVLEFVHSNPKEFARLTGARILAFWMRGSQLGPYPFVIFLMTMGGLIQAWRRGKRWAAFTSVLMLYPLVYYVSYTFARYRYPIEPLMYALAGYFVWELWVGIRRQAR
jgi:Dolichyl-phosphate-mannose-protein mannosyltransferase